MTREFPDLEPVEGAPTITRWTAPYFMCVCGHNRRTHAGNHPKMACHECRCADFKQNREG